MKIKLISYCIIFCLFVSCFFVTAGRIEKDLRNDNFEIDIIYTIQDTYSVVDTGQNSCYDISDEISCPNQGESFYGQDAQFLGKQPSYQNNGDGTVTDLNTC